MTYFKFICPGFVNHKASKLDDFYIKDNSDYYFDFQNAFNSFIDNESDKIPVPVIFEESSMFFNHHGVFYKDYYDYTVKIKDINTGINNWLNLNNENTKKKDENFNKYFYNSNNDEDTYSSLSGLHIHLDFDPDPDNQFIYLITISKNSGSLKQSYEIKRRCKKCNCELSYLLGKHEENIKPLLSNVPEKTFNLLTKRVSEYKDVINMNDNYFAYIENDMIHTQVIVNKSIKLYQKYYFHYIYLTSNQTQIKKRLLTDIYHSFTSNLYKIEICSIVKSPNTINKNTKNEISMLEFILNQTEKDDNLTPHEIQITKDEDIKRFINLCEQDRE